MITIPTKSVYYDQENIKFVHNLSYFCFGKKVFSVLSFKCTSLVLYLARVKHVLFSMKSHRTQPMTCILFVWHFNELSLVPQSIRHTLKHVSLLTWKIFIILQVVVVGRFYSFTGSLLHFPIDIWKPWEGGTPIWKGKECSSENLNWTPTGDLSGRCLGFIIPLKDST